MEAAAGEQLEEQDPAPRRRTRPGEGEGGGQAAYGGVLPLRPLHDVVKAYGVDQDGLLALGRRARAAKAEAAREAADGRLEEAA